MSPLFGFLAVIVVLALAVGLILLEGRGMMRWRRHVEVMRVRPGDVVVFRSDDRLGPETLDWIKKSMAEVFPNNRVAALDRGGRLEIVRQEDEA